MKLAQIDFKELGGVTGLKAEYTNVGAVIRALLPYLFAGAGSIFLIFIILAGLQLMLSRGDQKAIQSAQGKITNGIIGLLIVIFSYFIVRIFGIIIHPKEVLFD